MPTPGTVFGPPPQFPVSQAPTYDMGLIIPLANTTAATTTQNSADFYAQNFKGITVVLDVTVIGTGSLFLAIQGKDSASGKYFSILAGDATHGFATSNGTFVYTVYPGITATTPPVTGSQGNASASSILPATFRVQVSAINANPVTYTIGAVLTT